MGLIKCSSDLYGKYPYNVPDGWISSGGEVPGSTKEAMLTSIISLLFLEMCLQQFYLNSFDMAN